MSRRYYCDYCNRSFADDLDARKKHLQGTLHVRNRRQHYKQFRDLNTLLEEESSKTECRKFLQTGQCQFGDHCIYTHYSQAQLAAIKNEVEKEKCSKAKLPELPTVQSWLEKRNGTVSRCEASSVQPLYPSETQQLPISLRPMNFYDVINIDLNEWG